MRETTSQPDKVKPSGSVGGWTEGFEESASWNSSEMSDSSRSNKARIRRHIEIAETVALPQRGRPYSPDVRHGATTHQTAACPRQLLAGGGLAW